MTDTTPSREPRLTEQMDRWGRLSDDDAGRIATIMDIAWRGVNARSYTVRDGEPTAYVNEQARLDAEYLRSLEDSE